MPASFLLTDSLNWKYLGSVSGKNSITYPSNAKYLKCDVYYSKTEYAQAIHFTEEIDLSRLLDTYTHMYFGGYYHSNTNYASNNIAVNPASKIVYLVLNTLVGTNYSDFCTMDVWYC